MRAAGGEDAESRLSGERSILESEGGVEAESDDYHRDGGERVEAREAEAQETVVGNEKEDDEGGFAAGADEDNEEEEEGEEEEDDDEEDEVLLSSSVTPEGSESDSSLQDDVPQPPAAGKKAARERRRGSCRRTSCRAVVKVRVKTRQPPRRRAPSRHVEQGRGASERTEERTKHVRSPRRSREESLNCSSLDLRYN